MYFRNQPSLASTQQAAAQRADGTKNKGLALKPPVQNAVVQREVGFEMENKNVTILPQAEDARKAYEMATKKPDRRAFAMKLFHQNYSDPYPPAKTPIIQLPNLSVETDDTMGTANLEFVVHGDTRDKGIKFTEQEKLRTALIKAQTMAQIIASKKDMIFAASELDGSAGDFKFDTYGNYSGYIFQATAGLRIDKLHELISPISTVKRHSIGIEASSTIDFFSKAREVIDSSPLKPEVDGHKNRLYNFAALVAYNARQMYFCAPGEMLKNTLGLMARTSLAGMFAQLPKSNRDLLLQYPDDWVACIVEIASLAGKSDSVVKDSLSKEEPALASISRSAWLKAILTGTDLLAGTLRESASMGALKNKVDPGDPQRADAPKAQPIFEFRNMGGIGVAEFISKPMEFMKTIAEINKESEAANIRLL